MYRADVKWTQVAAAVVMVFAMAVAQVPVVGALATGGGNAITVGTNACVKGHGVAASDCAHYASGGKVTVCHFEDHTGDYAMAAAATCSNDE